VRCQSPQGKGRSCSLRDLYGVVTLADAVRALLPIVYPWH
jgi:hypothetical protein